MPAGVAEMCMTEKPGTHGSNPAEVHFFFLLRSCWIQCADVESIHSTEVVTEPQATELQ